MSLYINIRIPIDPDLADYDEDDKNAPKSKRQAAELDVKWFKDGSSSLTEFVDFYQDKAEITVVEE